MLPSPEDLDPELLLAPRGQKFAAHGSLLALLDDPSPAVWEPVFRELRVRGAAPIPELLQATKNANPVLRARARALVLSHQRRLRLRRLVSYAAKTRNHKGRFDLERAMWLFSALEGPRFDARPYRRELDELAENARLAFRGVRGELDRAMVLPNYLGDRFRFTVPKRSDGVPLAEEELDRATHHPHNIFLHRVVSKRRGLPLSLGIVWHLVAERLATPMELVGIPGHVLVRVPAGRRRILVDPCAGGRPVSRREVREYLEAYDIPFGPRIFEPMDLRGMLRRQVANYMRGMGLRGQIGQAEELLTLHALLDE
ncbi:MAG: hypothetical protein H8D72_01425 [Planctomycetes bacterium]|nr:hypothetical protein [Planctomycetota bacterium]